MQTNTHVCHWPGCTVEVDPKMWGCKVHWFKLPEKIRNKIWGAYRPGQEQTKDPSPQYVAAVREAMEWIRDWEKKREKQHEKISMA